MFLPDAEVEKAIEDIPTTSASAAGLESFPYLSLTDEHFELLNYALAKRSAPEGIDRTWNASTVMVRGADAGRDVLLTASGVAVGVIQCKRLVSSMSLPAVFREIAKFILFATINDDLRFNQRLSYILSVARDPAGTVVNFFTRPRESPASVKQELQKAVRKVRDKHKTLQALDIEEAERTVLVAYEMLDLHLLRPHDLDEWMCREVTVSRRFFRQRVVLDNDSVAANHAEMMRKLESLYSTVQATRPITDKDIAILRDDIEAIPETHRRQTGFAMLFGFPPEMFENSDETKIRLSRLAELINEMNGDYINWVFDLAQDKAKAIIDAQPWWSIKPYARQIPRQFMGFVAQDCVRFALMGEFMSSVLAKLTPPPLPSTDDEKLQRIRADLIEDGVTFLGGDYSNLTGDDKLVSLKKVVISKSLVDLASRRDIEVALDAAIPKLRGLLIAAADELRATCKHKITVVLTGTRGFDGPDALRRIAETWHKPSGVTSDDDYEPTGPKS